MSQDRVHMQMKENASLFVSPINSFWQWVAHTAWGPYNHQARARLVVLAIMNT